MPDGSAKPTIESFSVRPRPDGTVETVLVIVADHHVSVEHGAQMIQASTQAFSMSDGQPFALIESQPKREAEIWDALEDLRAMVDDLRKNLSVNRVASLLLASPLPYLA